MAVDCAHEQGSEGVTLYVVFAWRSPEGRVLAAGLATQGYPVFMLIHKHGVSSLWDFGLVVGHVCSA
jgi:hypothetical protein